MKAFRHNCAGANNTVIPKFDVSQNYGAGTDPTSAPYSHHPALHGKLLGRYAYRVPMIRVGDEYAWAEHILIAYFNTAARVDDAISIEIVSVTNRYANSLRLALVRPKPAAFCERIKVSDLYSGYSTKSNTLQPIALAGTQSHQPIEKYAYSACKTSRRFVDQTFD